MNVVIVESAAKAKTINKYLGSKYKVLASYGHVRDLPPKDGSVEPDNDFHMHWDVDGKSQKVMKEIAAAVKNADKLILATDPDREGEAISWHILRILEERKALKKGLPVERVTFNAVTKQSVLDAFKQPRAIDDPLVESYLARRALDYLVGFTLSPVLWRKLPGARSAGRVQSVALRLVCDREAEIEAFKTQEYWSIEALLATRQGRDVHRPARGHRRQAGRPARHQGRGLGARHQGGHRGRRIPGHVGGEEGGAAQPGRAVHHLHAAAGGLAQARLLGQADHEPRPTPLRGRGDRRRGDRPHHLHANRRRNDHPGGHRRHPRADRAGLLQALRAALHPRVQGQGQERPGGARGDPAHRRAPQARRGGALSGARPGAALRADLEARRGEPDGLRRAGADHGRDRGAGPRRQGLRPARHRHGRDVRRLHAPLRGRPRRPPRQPRTARPTRRPRTRTTAAACRRWPRATRWPTAASRPSSTSPSRRRASPRRRW